MFVAFDSETKMCNIFNRNDCIVLDSHGMVNVVLNDGNSKVYEKVWL